MRVMMRVQLPVGPANDAARDGELGQTIASILEEQKPEAVYFLAEDGERTALLFLELAHASDIPRLAEPWFLAFEAAIDIKPVMVPADLAEAGPAIAAAAEKFG